VEDLNLVPDHIVVRLIFRWLAIPWLQAELDSYRERRNGTKRRYDKNKLLPRGVPNDIFQNPSQPKYEDAKDFMVRENIAMSHVY
jgi:hypothetical protein